MIAGNISIDSVDNKIFTFTSFRGHSKEIITKNNQIPECPRNVIIVSKMRRPYQGKDGNMKEGIFSSILFYHIVSLLP